MGEQLLQKIMDPSFEGEGLPDSLVLALGMTLRGAANAASTEQDDEDVPSYVAACTVGHDFAFNLFGVVNNDDEDEGDANVERYDGSLSGIALH